LSIKQVRQEDYGLNRLIVRVRKGCVTKDTPFLVFRWFIPVIFS
jgi:hypothetical protein